MKKFATAALAAGGALLAFAASAQTNDMMYTTGTGDNMMVMGGMAGDKGAPIAMSKEACKEGGYYMSGDKMITACAQGGMSYDLSMPESGAMMGGKPYPQGAMMMKQRNM